MHLHLLGPDLSASLRRLFATRRAARTPTRFGLLRVVLDEYRRAAAAARRYEQLTAQGAARAQLGINRADVARRVFDEYYADAVRQKTP